MNGRRRATELLGRWGLQAARLRCVSRSDCEIWRLTTTAGDERALRIHAADRDDASALETEARWLQAMCEAGLQVPAPQPLPAGGWVAHFDDELGRPRHVLLLGWLRGRMLVDGLRPLHLRRVGELLARMHQAARALQAAGGVGSRREAWAPDIDGWAEGRKTLPPAWGRPELAHQARRSAAALQSEVAGWTRDDAARCWIHGDPHPWNLLFADGAAGAIDFSDGGWGWPAQDLAAALQFIRYPLPGRRDLSAQFEACLDSLFDGYARWAPVDEALVARSRRWIQARLLHTLQWMAEDWPSLRARPWGPAFADRLRVWLPEP